MLRIDSPARHWCQNSASCDSESPGRPVLAICITSPTHINSDVLHRPIEPAVYSVEKLGSRRVPKILKPLQASVRVRHEGTSGRRNRLLANSSVSLDVR